MASQDVKMSPLSLTFSWNDGRGSISLLIRPIINLDLVSGVRNDGLGRDRIKEENHHCLEEPHCVIDKVMKSGVASAWSKIEPLTNNCATRQ
jgi:hypothetical protein